MSDKIITAIEQVAPGNGVESSYPERPWFFNGAMPVISRRILESQSLAEIVAARRERYRQWCAALVGRREVQLIHADLDAETCPWAVPVLLRGRKGRDRELRQRGVAFFTFGEEPHASFANAILPDQIRGITQRLINEMICFPVHPQVTPEDIQRSVSSLDAIIGQSAHP